MVYFAQKSNQIAARLLNWRIRQESTHLHVPERIGNTTNFPNYVDTNIYVVYSDDDGKTWSTPFAIPKTNTNTRMMPNIAVDQTTGNIGVAWLDAVNDPANIKVQVFATVLSWIFFD